MFRILRRRDRRKGTIATVEFEGEPYGAALSLFLGNLRPGKGPGLHKHPIPKRVSSSPVKRPWWSMGKRSLPAPATLW